MRLEGNPLDRISHFVHARFLWLLLATYAVAAAWPGPGLALRGVSVGRFSMMGESMDLTMPWVLRAFTTMSQL